MSKLTTPSAIALASTDIKIRISQDFGHVHFSGTRAQLEAESLAPVGAKWPSHFDFVNWEDDRFSYQLQRSRPVGIKGPRSAYAEADCWIVWRNRHGVNWLQSRIEQKAKELMALLKPKDSFKDWKRFFKAERDSAYQAFRAQMLGELAPHKRGPKAKAAASSQGVSA